MEKRNKICLIIIIICTIAVIAICGFAIYQHSKIDDTDALKFKNEFELLNDQKIGDTNDEYLSVSITEDNPIIYKSPKEILDVLNNENAIVLFGYASSNECRNIIETLFQVAKEKKIDKIYYVDILNIRDEYVFANSIMPAKTKEATEAYKEILKFFGDKLDVYYVQDEVGNNYSTGVRRLYPGTVVAVRSGEILEMSVFSETKKMNDQEKQALEQIYKDMFDKFNLDDAGVCSDTAC